MDSIFDPESQHDQVGHKIIAGLDRISQALRSMMWEEGKEHGLTPIQIQCLVFIQYHQDKENRAGQLAREFDVTPATISQAVRVLAKKGFIEKTPLAHDARIQILKLTDAGRTVCARVENWANTLLPYLEKLSQDQQETIFSFLTNLISDLQKDGRITVTRQCRTCRFFKENDRSTGDVAFYCKLLEKEMSAIQLRTDCPEHEVKRR